MTNEQKNMIIEQIIFSLKNYALADIKDNISRPIAAFILCSCFIDQMAAYRYNYREKANALHYKKFIKEYDALQLYDSIRCKLVHNYSIDDYITIGSDNTFAINNKTNATYITITSFIIDLEKAFDKFCTDIRSKRNQTRNNAILCHKDSPILKEGVLNFTACDEIEADLLITYFSPQLKGKLINNNPNLTIDYLSKENNNESFFVYANTNWTNDIQYNIELTQINAQLGLISPIEALTFLKNK